MLNTVLWQISIQSFKKMKSTCTTSKYMYHVATLMLRKIEKIIKTKFHNSQTSQYISSPKLHMDNTMLWQIKAHIFRKINLIPSTTRKNSKQMDGGTDWETVWFRFNTTPQLKSFREVWNWLIYKKSGTALLRMLCKQGTRVK